MIQLNFAQEIEVFCILFRCHGKNRKSSIKEYKKHTEYSIVFAEYFNFRGKIQLDFPVHLNLCEMKLESWQMQSCRTDALWGLFLYSALMFTSPVIVYFGAKNIAETHFEAEPPWSLLGPAIAAVATANGVIVLYVMKAFRESSMEQESDKKSN